MQEDRITFLYLAVSILGLITVSLFLCKPANSTSSGYVVYSIFSVLCILGIIATIFPKKCSHRELSTDLDASRYSFFGGLKIVHGHHILCDGFRSHEIKLKDKTVCAACLGLMLGAIAALLIASHHFLGGYSYPLYAGYLGLGFILIGLIYIPVINPFNSVFRMLYNLLFVVGFSLLLVVVDNKGSLSLDIITLGMCVFWMYSRIQFSWWGHNRICRECLKKCEYYQ